jgi:DNA invertase Pin-like site-specific DNA recombinase
MTRAKDGVREQRIVMEAVVDVLRLQRTCDGLVLLPRRQDEVSIQGALQARAAHLRSQGQEWEIVADYVEPGVSRERRPAAQVPTHDRHKPPAFDVIVVHSFSRFFRDQFQLEFFVRRLAKSGVRLVSITQELGDDPMSNMIRQIMALFDEYQSKENAKHTLRAMKENAL